MAIIYCDGDTELAKGMAVEAADILVNTYPNHSWWVECRGGCLIIKHFEMSGHRGHVGMVRHTRNLNNDAKARKQDIIRAAGEMMERAGVRRGANTGDPVTHFEFDNPKMAKHWHRPFIKIPVIH